MSILNLIQLESKYVHLCFLLLLCFGVGCFQTLEINSGPGSYHVTTNSMEPNISSGNVLIINPDAYKNDLPTRGDIIVFVHPRNPDVTLLKRIIGLPGEKIEMNNQAIWIDGELLEEDYIQKSANYSGQWTMNTEEYFVLGDNRNNSSDSHHWGGVPLENIIGKATHICVDDSLNKCIAIEEGS